MEKRFIAFLDILGFKEHVKAAQDDEDVSTKIQKLLETFSSLASQHTFKVTAKGPGHTAYEGNPEVSSYSDNIVISIGLPADDHPTSLILFKTLLDLISCINLIALENGFILRGGITYGKIFHRSNIVWGAGIIDAIECEKQAKYPRIIISADAYKKVFFDQIKENKTNPEIFLDTDGYFYLNWLLMHRWAQLGVFKPQEHYEKLKNLAVIVKNNLQKHFYGEHYKYWCWFSHYFNKSMDIMQKIVNPELKLDFTLLKITFPTD